MRPILCQAQAFWHLIPELSVRTSNVCRRSLPSHESGPGPAVACEQRGGWHLDGTTGLSAPLSFPCHFHSCLDFQPLTSRQTQATDDHKQGRFKENAVLCFITKHAVCCRAARCTNPRKRPWQRMNGFVEKNSVAKKMRKKISLSFWGGKEKPAF